MSHVTVWSVTVCNCLDSSACPLLFVSVFHLSLDSQALDEYLGLRVIYGSCLNCASP